MKKLQNMSLWKSRPQINFSEIIDNGKKKNSYNIEP